VCSLIQRRGVSELFVDLMMLIIVMGLTAGISLYTFNIVNSYKGMSENPHYLSNLKAYALILNVSRTNFLIIANYGDSLLNCSVYLGYEEGGLVNVLVNPKDTYVIPLSDINQASNAMILCNGSMLKLLSRG